MNSPFLCKATTFLQELKLKDRPGWSRQSLCYHECH